MLEMSFVESVDPVEEADMYGVLSRVPAPVEMYDALHAEVLRRGDGKGDGLLFHVARATDDGFEVVEVWESREQFERFNRDVVLPVVTDLAPGAPPPTTGQGYVEFEVRGLVVPSAGIYD
jgi:hypothetical protein